MNLPETLPPPPPVLIPPAMIRDTLKKVSIRCGNQLTSDNALVTEVPTDVYY